MSRYAVIPAAGRGSRLGPITAQRSKALVTVGQQPILIHQLLQLRDAGVDVVAVVVSLDTHAQVTETVRRSGLDNDLVIIYPIQREPLGPVNAILVGLDALPDSIAGVYVLMSDSFINEPLPQSDVDWVGIAAAPTTRSFCYDVDDIYVDGIVDAGTFVTVGINYLASSDDAYNCASLVADNDRAAKFGEIPMSEFFNAYTDLRGPLAHQHLETWLDVGDVAALARAHRSRFISRSHHRLELDASGIIVKYGEGEAFERQLNWLLEKQESGNHHTANLTPRVYEAFTSPERPSWYAMEYVDLPTLAELWLYWPGRPDVWQSLLQNVVFLVGLILWTGGHENEPTANVLWFVDKTRDRLAMRGLPEWHAVAEPLLDGAEELLRATPSELVRGHGDLNFSNILYSLNTGMIKLIDPRGDHLVPWLYEFAKLRFSYHGGYAAITHGLATRDGTKVTLLPSRTDEIQALDDVMNECVDLDLLTVCEGCCMLSSAPLHDGEEAKQLFWRGVELLSSVLDHD